MIYFFKKLIYRLRLKNGSNGVDKIKRFIKLDKPLVIFDIMATGSLISRDKIIELSYIKILPDGRVKRDNIFLNPEIKISEEASEVCGVRNEDFLDKPRFRDKAQEIWSEFYGCDFGGFNVFNFDLPILRREFIRVGLDFDYSDAVIFDAKMIYKYMEPITLSGVFRYYYKKGIRDDFDPSESINATVEILGKQFKNYRDLRDKNFIKDINEAGGSRRIDNRRKFYWKKGEAYFAFSKYKDISVAKVAELNPDFLKWIISADFSEETKGIIKNVLKRMKN